MRLEKGRRIYIMHVSKILVFILVGTSVLFTIQNLVMVEIQFLFWSFSLPRAVLLVVIFAIGFLTGWLVNSYLTHKEKEK